MPSSTFFRLPQEKRERLLCAATDEFARTTFAEASINRIVQSARIPRGSFYQYFEGKEDLFFFLLESMKDSYIKTLGRAISEVNGDVFAMPLRMFDLLITADGEPVAELAPCVKILKLNQSMDVHGMLEGNAQRVLPQLFEKLDRSIFSRQDEEFITNVFHLLIFARVCSMLETLWDKNKYAHQRSILTERVEIIRNGSGKAGGKKQ